MTVLKQPKVLEGWSQDTPEFKRLVKEYAAKNAANSLLETKINQDTKSYISEQGYLDDVNLIAFNTLVPAIEIVLGQTKDAHTPQAKAFIAKQINDISDYFEKLFWEFVIIGYLSTLISCAQPDSPLAHAKRGFMKRRSAKSIGKEMNKEFEKSVINARMFNYLTQGTLQIYLQLSSMVDDMVLEEVPVLYPLIGKDPSGNKEYTEGRDCLVLLGLGTTLAVNDLLGK